MDMNWIDEIRDPETTTRNTGTRITVNTAPAPVAAVRGERHVDHVRCLRGRIPSNRLQDGDRRSA